MASKKGADKILSVYWFAILIIVAGAIAYIVGSFYGKPYDIRNIEVGILSDRTADCVSYAGYIRDGVLTTDFQQNLLSKCNLNFNTEDAYDWKQQGQYFLDINIYNFSSYPNSNSLLEASAGNPNLKGFCSTPGPTSPLCLEREFYTIDKSGKQYIVKIMAIVDKIKKNTQ